MAKKHKYHFNSETLSFEREKNGLSKFLRQFSLHAFTSIVLAIILVVSYSLLITPPKEQHLIKENEQLITQVNLLNEDIKSMQEVLFSLENRDNNLYRVIFQADSIPSSIRNKALKNTQRFKQLDDLGAKDLILETLQSVDNLKKGLYMQSKSYDELLKLIKTHEKKLKCVPGIQPVLNKDLSRIASGFGIRIDPVYGTYRKHNGLDFAAPRGTPIYATGNGVVTKSKQVRGYGNEILIDHGFSYETRYCHLHKRLVKVGDKVVRGEIIGEVGSTGKSTGPHLHYEVIYKGTPVNPINYFFIDLSPEEYDKMMEIANNAGQLMD